MKNSNRSVIWKLLTGIFVLGALTSCGVSQSLVKASDPLTPLSQIGVVVHGRAVYTITNEEPTALMKILNKVLPSSYAASGSTTVTYSNAASTNFSIDVTGFTPSGFSGNTLNLGKVSLLSLSDNNLKVCGSSSNTKCTKAAIRVYTTGSTAGFVQTIDGYGAPVYAGSLNPSTPVGLGAADSVQTQTFTIASNRNKVNFSDFPTPNYNVSSDFSNAGAGSYSMTFVVEYILLP